jgi:hypothetical protein
VLSHWPTWKWTLIAAVFLIFGGFALSTLFEYESPGVLVGWIITAFGLGVAVLAAIYGGISTLILRRRLRREKQ